MKTNEKIRKKRMLKPRGNDHMCPEGCIRIFIMKCKQVVVEFDTGFYHRQILAGRHTARRRGGA